MRKILRRSLVLLTIPFYVGCHAQEKSEQKGNPMFVDMNGMILGENTNPPKVLKVAMGETLDVLREKNLYIPETPVDMQRGFYLPLMTNLQLHFDDGDMRFDVPCAESSTVSSGPSLSGSYPIVRRAGGKLCGEIKDDWTRATKQAAQIAQTFEKQNPTAINVKKLQSQLTHEELKKISKDLLGFFDESKPLELYDEARANELFAKLAAEGHYEQMKLNQNTFIHLATYLGKTSIMSIGISKHFFYGGRDELPENIKDTMRYTVSVTFSRREDIGEPKINSLDIHPQKQQN